MKNDCFVERLRQAIKKDGISVQELAQRLCVSKSAIYNYIEGRNTPTVEMLLGIADVLCVSIDWVLGRKDDERL